jgi:hypothetical protein
MPDEAVVREQAPQVRMAMEQDAEQVEGFALEPVRAGMHPGHRRQRRLVVGGAIAAQGHPLVVRDRQQLVAGREAAPFRNALVHRAVPRPVHPAAETRGARRGGAPLVAAVVQVVDAGNVHQHLEAQRRFVPQRGEHVEQVGGADVEGELAVAHGPALQAPFAAGRDDARGQTLDASAHVATTEVR